MNPLVLARPRNLMWIPAACLIAYAIVAASGVQFAPETRAATGSVTVTSTVLPQLSIGGTCVGSTQDEPSLAVNVDDTLIGGTCTVTYSSNNNSAGIALRVRSPRPSGNAFCRESVHTNACGAFASFSQATGVADIPDGGFGVNVSATTCDTPAWTAGTNDRALPTGANTDVCTTEAMGAGASTTFGFYADTLAAQQAGGYFARADFTVAAL